MRRTPWSRAIAGLLALWFPLVVGEPSIVHACRVHDAPAESASVATNPAAIQHAAMHHAAHGAHGPSDTQSHQHQGCTCVSCCTATAASIAAPVGSIVTIVIAQQQTGPLLGTGAPPSRARPDHFLPETTGPPRA